MIFNRWFPGSFISRHTIAVSVAVLVALFTGQYLIPMHHGWLVITTLLVMQTARGTPLKQVMYFSLSIIFGVLSGLAFLIYLTPLMMSVVLGAVFIIVGYWLLANQAYAYATFYAVRFFIIAMLLTALAPRGLLTFIQGQLIDILAGTLIGIVCTLLIFPVKLDAEFKRSMQAMLAVYMEMIEANIVFLSTGESGRDVSINAHRALESQLRADEGVYPEWIYDTGFNQGLRAGFRFFMVYMERVAETLFSMHGIMTNLEDNALFKSIATPLVEVLKNNNVLLGTLKTFFSLGTLQETSLNFTHDIEALDAKLKDIIPKNIALLEMDAEMLALSSLCRDAKDMRQLLLALVMAVTAKTHSL